MLMKFIFGGLLLFFSISLHTEEDHLFGQWTGININGSFWYESPWIYTFEAQIRSSEYPENGNITGYDIGSIPISLGVGYKSNNNSFIIGYQYQYIQPPLARKDVNENTGFQQYANIQDFSSYGKVQLRTRLEERTLESYDGTAIRIRQQIKYNIPIDSSFGFVISEECFFNFNTVSWGPDAGFDQNRFFIGPYFQVNKNIKLEIGYQNLFIDRDLVDDLMSHILLININYNL